MLQLERLKATSLRDVSVLVVTPDSPEESRALIAAVEKQRHVRFTHRFLSAPRVRTLKHPSTESDARAPRLPPSLVLVDREGLEAWRFLESDHRKKPADAEVARAVVAAEARTR